jgi:hypothetical protein
MNSAAGVLEREPLLAPSTLVFDIGGGDETRGIDRLTLCRAVMGGRRSSRWKHAEGENFVREGREQGHTIPGSKEGPDRQAVRKPAWHCSLISS